MVLAESDDAFKSYRARVDAGQLIVLESLNGADGAAFLETRFSCDSKRCSKQDRCVWKKGLAPKKKKGTPEAMFFDWLDGQPEALKKAISRGRADEDELLATLASDLPRLRKAGCGL